MCFQGILGEHMQVVCQIGPETIEFDKLDDIRQKTFLEFFHLYHWSLGNQVQ